MTASLVWVHHKSTCLAMSALHHVSTLDLQPPRFARGAFCSSLVAAKLMNYHDLFPNADTAFAEAEWADIFSHGESSNCPAYPTCILPQDAQRSMIQLVEQALRVEFEELRRDGALFVDHMRTVRSFA